MTARRILASTATLAGLALAACTAPDSGTAADAAQSPTGSPAAAEPTENGPDGGDQDHSAETSGSRGQPGPVYPDQDDLELLSEDHLAEGVEMPDCLAGHSHVHVQPESVYDEDGLAPFCSENEVLVQCTDKDALSENAGHQPAGWPSDWEEGQPLPDPECHPDFIEIYTWDKFDDFHACWDGPETSGMVRTPSMSDQDVYESEWERSQLRAQWEQPGLEVWEEKGVDLDTETSPDCVASYQDAG